MVAELLEIEIENKKNLNLFFHYFFFEVFFLCCITINNTIISFFL